MKIAVIIVGKFDFNIDILSETIRCYDLNNENTDIFIYNNSTTETNNNFLKMFGNKIKCIKLFDEKLYNIWYNELVNKNSRHEKWNKFTQKCIEIINKSSEYSIHVPFKKRKFFTNRTIQSAEQYYQFIMGINEIIKYESENNFKYDYIMKIRFDFFLKNHRFGPNHYFTNNDDILLKDYFNLKKYYDSITEEDNYHKTEFRINNYLYWRTTKYLGGQFNLNLRSYNIIKDNINDRLKFNEIISDKFIITINDAVFFGSRDNMIKVSSIIYNNYGNHYDDSNYFWWTPESQLLMSIIDEKLYYFDYLQNYNYYNVREMWVNDYHGTEKYDKSEMKTS